MSSPDPEKQPLVIPFRFGSRRQQRIYNLLERIVSQGTALFFCDACRLLDTEPTFDTTTHLVGHALREVESALRAVLQPLDPPEAPICEACGAHKEGHKTVIDAIAKTYHLSAQVHAAWLEVGPKGKIGIERRTHRDNLELPRPRDAAFDAFTDRFEDVLEAVLIQADTSYSHVLDELDAMLEKALPDAADIDRLQHHVPHDLATLRYLFEHLTSPTWLAKLSAAHFFDRIPAKWYDSATEQWYWQPWPQGTYLQRVAAHPGMQRQVADIAARFSDTDNPYVQGDLAAIMALLPAKLATAFVDPKVRWLDRGGGSYLEDQRLSKTVLHLAQADQKEAAWRLAHALLASLSNQSADLTLFEGVLQTVIPDLIEYTGMPGFEQLCDELVADVAPSSEELGPMANFPDDGSQYWYPAIEDPTKGIRMHTAREALLTAVSMAADQLLQSGRVARHEVVDVLKRRGWNMFTRVALDVLCRYDGTQDDIDASDLAGFAVNQQYFDAFALSHEYQLLLRERFSELSTANQTIILGWIEAGPPRRDGETSPEYERAVEEWRRDKLSLLRPLSAEWERRYQDLVARFGEPELPETAMNMQIVDATASYRALERYLNTLSIADVAAFLRTWQPSGRSFEASRATLGNILRSQVQAQPMTFSKEAHSFNDVDLIYVSALLKGWALALQQRNAVAWDPVLGLCEDIIHRQEAVSSALSVSPAQEPAPGAEDNLLAEGARSSWENGTAELVDFYLDLAQLLSVGLNYPAGEIPVSVQRRVWHILQYLAANEHPTATDEASYQHADPSSRALNTVRGMAIQTLVFYGNWLRRHESELDTEPIREALKALDAHAAIADDPAITVHVQFGRYVPQLANIDIAWMRERTGAIFPQRADLRALREATWEAFVRYNGASVQVFSFLRNDYAWAIEHIGRWPARAQRDVTFDPDVRLAEHIMDLIAYGGVLVEPVDTLLEQFYEKASDALRAKGVAYIGRRLAHGHAEEDVVRRLQEFCEYRLGATPAAGDQEMEAFGRWFGADCFDPLWALTQLASLLERTDGEIDGQYGVVERLGELVEPYPRQVMGCLRLLIHSRQFTDRVELNEATLYTLLEKALHSGDTDAEQQATETINILLRQGFHRARTLLGGNGSADT